jgi:hypothetical protein
MAFLEIVFYSGIVQAPLKDQGPARPSFIGPFLKCIAEGLANALLEVQKAQDNFSIVKFLRDMVLNGIVHGFETEGEWVDARSHFTLEFSQLAEALAHLGAEVLDSDADVSKLAFDSKMLHAFFDASSDHPEASPCLVKKARDHLSSSSMVTLWKNISKHDFGQQCIQASAVFVSRLAADAMGDPRLETALKYLNNAQLPKLCRAHERTDLLIITKSGAICSFKGISIIKESIVAVAEAAHA